MKRVLVLDANQRSALAATRSLGRKGVTILTADDTPSALAGSSKYSSRYQCYPSPRHQSESFIDHVRQIVTEEEIGLILPMTELTTELLLHARPYFQHAVLPFAGLSSIESLSNKSNLHRLAQSLQVPIPETWYVDEPGNMPDILSELPYPLVLKPAKSWLQLDGQWQRVGVRLAANPAQAEQIIATHPEFQSAPYMLQRCVEGIGQGVFCLYNHGADLAHFSHRRLREKPPTGGVSVLSESVPVNPVLLKHAQTLLDKVNWHGVAMVEFKVAPNGTPYLMEINTRFWGTLQLAVDAGVDFPWLLYGLASGQPVTPVTGYNTGQRLRWLLGDLDSLYLTLRDPDINWSAKLARLCNFFWPHPLSTRHEVDRWSDLAPFWWELRQYLRDLRS